MAKPNGSLILTEAGINALNSLLGELQQELEARAVLLIEKSGTLITAQGLTTTLDTMSLAALISGSFASTRALARLLGEKGFRSLYQQGRSEGIFIAALDTGDTLAVVFGEGVQIGLVKFKSLQALDAVNTQLRALYSDKKPSLGALGAAIDQLF